MMYVKATVDMGKGWQLKLRKMDGESNWPLRSEDRARLASELRGLLRDFAEFVKRVDYADITIE